MRHPKMQQICTVKLQHICTWACENFRVTDLHQRNGELSCMSCHTTQHPECNRFAPKEVQQICTKEGATYLQHIIATHLHQRSAAIATHLHLSIVKFSMCNRFAPKKWETPPCMRCHTTQQRGRLSSKGRDKSSGLGLSLSGSQFGGCSTTYNTLADTWVVCRRTG